MSATQSYPSHSPHPCTDRHGDMLFAQFPRDESMTSQPAPTPAPSILPFSSSAYFTQPPSNHPVDIKLAKENGLVHRPRDPQLYVGILSPLAPEWLTAFVHSHYLPLSPPLLYYSCRHGEKGMCDYCSPLEPYDPKYLMESAIKHASFHAHLRHLLSNQSKTSDPAHQPPPLEEPDFRVKSPCPGKHEPWPRGICSKCQPSAVTLNRQVG